MPANGASARRQVARPMTPRAAKRRLLRREQDRKNLRWARLVRGRRVGSFFSVRLGGDIRVAPGGESSKRPIVSSQSRQTRLHLPAGRRDGLELYEPSFGCQGGGKPDSSQRLGCGSG